MLTEQVQGWKFVLALLALIASAYISITLPISEKGIPFTAQSLMVFYLAGIFKPKTIGLIILSYLLLGSLGLPVFAEGSSGWSKLTGASGGFLYGFLFSGLVISSMIGKSGKVKMSTVLWAMLLGTIVLFCCGLGQLSYKFGWSKALEYGFYPFWIMALVKAGIAAFLVFLTKSRFQRVD